MIKAVSLEIDLSIPMEILTISKSFLNIPKYQFSLYTLITFDDIKY